ncbi:MAG: general secretion pathway protein GspB [bacterium]
MKKDDKAYPPAVSSYPPRAVGKPAVDESSLPTGFSVQAIAWSKVPAERIAVINGEVLREGGFVGGIQVDQIGLDEVSLKKGDKTWLLKCGR